jgi:hypothetical protein
LRHPIRDDGNATLPLAFIVTLGSVWRKLEGLPLQQKDRANTVSGWLGAACVLAMVCLSATSGRAQDSGSNPAPAAKTDSAKTTGTKTDRDKTAGPKTASPKKHANGSKASAYSATEKAHSSSHPSSGKSKSSPTVTAHNSTGKHASSHKSGKKKTTARGQQKIDSERAQAIQEALVREHYMSGEPTGTWNQSSEDAMRRYQADHGWQSKTVPDSRALISLGLGPSHDHLLNPESAMTTGPNISHTAAPVSTASPSPLSHSAEAGARTNTTSIPSADPPPTPSSDHDASGPQ